MQNKKRQNTDKKEEFLQKSAQEPEKNLLNRLYYLLSRCTMLEYLFANKNVEKILMYLSLHGKSPLNFSNIDLKYLACFIYATLKKEMSLLRNSK